MKQRSVYLKYESWKRKELIIYALLEFTLSDRLKMDNERRESEWMKELRSYARLRESERKKKQSCVFFVLNVNPERRAWHFDVLYGKIWLAINFNYSPIDLRNGVAVTLRNVFFQRANKSRRIPISRHSLSKILRDWHACPRNFSLKLRIETNRGDEIRFLAAKMDKTLPLWLTRLPILTRPHRLNFTVRARSRYIVD